MAVGDAPGTGALSVVGRGLRALAWGDAPGTGAESIGAWDMFLKRAGRFLLDLLLIAAGSVLMALAVDVFLDPNDVVLGGGFKPLLHPRLPYRARPR